MVVGLSLRAFRNSIENWFPNEFISVLAVCSQNQTQGGSHDSSVGSIDVYSKLLEARSCSWDGDEEGE